MGQGIDGAIPLSFRFAKGYWRDHITFDFFCPAWYNILYYRIPYKKTPKIAKNTK
jgi:hypothetical protein